MCIPSHPKTPLLALMAIVAVLTVGSSNRASAQPMKIDDELKFKKYDEMMKNIPTVKELLKEKPVDWVVLWNMDVVVVKPVKPRPNLKNTKRTLEQITDLVKAGMNLPLDKRKKLPFLYVTLVEGGGANPEKKIHFSNIDKEKQILHHEDLLLLRIAMLQDEGNLELAFELLFDLKRSNPGWPTIPNYERRQLLTEARQHLQKKQHSPALVRLEELHERFRRARAPMKTPPRDPMFEEAKTLFGQAVSALADAALKTDDFRRARHYVGRLHRREPKHAVVEKYRKALEGRATAVLNRARSQSKAGGHDVAADLVDQAADIWPDTPGLKSAYVNMSKRFQRLRVGVRRLSGETSPYFLRTLADERTKYLMQTQLFESNNVDEMVYYGTRYFDEWTPTDLGRQTVFKLQTSRPYWLPQPAVTASVIARNLRLRLDDPKSPLHDERLKSYVRSVRVNSPTQLEIRFSRVPPRLESLLRFPLRRVERDATARKNKAGSAGDKASEWPLISARFAAHKSDGWTKSRQVYRRFTAEPAGVREYHVAQVEEIRFGSHVRAIQALKRGKVDMLAHVRPRDVEALRDDRRFVVRQYAVPVTHVLQFNPDSLAMRNRLFRRALAYALDRPSMLRNIVLRGAEDDRGKTAGRIVSAPYFSKSYAYDKNLRPRKHDITLALALTLTVRKQYERAYQAAVGATMLHTIKKRGAELGWIPKLRMLVAPGDVPKKVAEACVKQWGRIGIKVEIVIAGAVGKGTPDWDIIYRTARMTDPVVDLWPFLTFDDRARVEGLRYLPDWFRQELVRMDLAADWSKAVVQVKKLHGYLADEALLIPLWEVDDYLAVRKNVTTIRDGQFKPVHTYQNIEQWLILRDYPANYP